MFHDGEVVRDEDQREIERANEVGEEVEDLRLDGDVEGGDGFVGDDDLGVEGEGAGDGDALTLSAGELVRVFLHVARGQAHLAHELGDAGGDLGRRTYAVDEQRLGEGREDRHAWIKRGERILEDHLQVAADAGEIGGGAGGEVFAFKDDGAGGGRDQLHDRATEGGFARAGFSDEADDLSALHGEAHAIDGADGCGGFAEEAGGATGEMRFDGANFENGFVGVGRFFDGCGGNGGFCGEVEPGEQFGFGNGLREVGREAGNGEERTAFFLKGGDAALEGFGVRMLRVAEKRAGVGGFHDASGIHDLHVVAETGDDAEIVRHENDRHAELALEIFDEGEDLRLHGDVEGGGRFVGDEDVGARDEGHGDHHPLPHAAGELVRVTVHAAGGVGDADGLKHGEGAGEGVAAGDFFVDEERLDDLVGDPHVGVERRHRVLENHRDAFAADGARLGGRAVQQVHAIEHRGAAFDASGRLGDETHEREARHGFARAGFADDAEDLAAFEMEADAVHRAINAAARVKISAKVGDRQNRHGEKGGAKAR